MSRCTLVWSAVTLFLCASVGQAAIEPDFLMDTNPEFRSPPRVKNFSPRYKSLWIEALQRSDVDMQRMAAETIAQAHRHGFDGLAESVPILEKILMAETSHPAARFAVARALIVLDSRSSSDKLLKAAQDYGADLRQLVEPALAEWDFVPAREIWIKRLETPHVRQRDLMLAIRGLGRVRDTAALSLLVEIASDLLRGSDLRLESARSAGQIAETGLEQEADRLAHEQRNSPLVNRLCAIGLLNRHQSEGARKLLGELAHDAESVVVAASLERLNAIDPELVLPFAEKALKDADPRVREQGVAAYLRLLTNDRVLALSLLLNDPHPAIRSQISESLFRRAQNSEFDAPVREAAVGILAGDSWQGQEQAALLLAALEHKPAASRLVELLESPRPEVMVASAWGLRKVAVPATIPAIIDKARRQTEIRIQNPGPGIDHQVAHLFEACGVMGATEATPLVLRYIPKNLAMGERSRSAAIWAIGWVHQGHSNSDLAKALIDRVDDVAIRPPENSLVKLQCVIALARIKAVDQAPALRLAVEKTTLATPVGLAKVWAVKELTGDVMPEPVPENADPGSWFLEPIP